MTQALYAHMNNKTILKNKFKKENVASICIYIYILYMYIFIHDIYIYYIYI
jgi:hypothetical protein